MDTLSLLHVSWPCLYQPSVSFFLFCESLLSLGQDSWTFGLFWGKPGLCDVQTA